MLFNMLSNISKNIETCLNKSIYLYRTDIKFLHNFYPKIPLSNIADTVACNVLIFALSRDQFGRINIKFSIFCKKPNRYTFL